MDWHAIVGVIGGIIAFLAIIPYIRDIIKKTTRPNAVSWLIWAILLFISIIAQFSAGSSWSIILIIGDLLGTCTIFVLCLFGYGYRKYGRVEWICLALAVVAIIAWQLTKQPTLAILFAVIADTMAATPTLVKAYKDPWSEHPTMWLFIAFGALLSILSTTIFDLPNLLFPVYLFLVNISTGLIALIGRRLKKPAVVGEAQ